MAAGAYLVLRSLVALVPLNGLVLVVLLRRVLQHWTGSAAGAGRPVVVEVVAVAGSAALLVRPRELVDDGVPVPALPSRTRRCRWAALRAAALRCELRAASCCAALLGVGGPEWHARDG